MIRPIIFLDDLLIFENTVEEILVARVSVIFLLQHLEFAINFKKCVLELTQEIEFLGMLVKSKTITLSVSQEKVQKIKSQCLELYRAQEITLLEITSLLGTLTYTIQAILPTRFQFWYLQQQQIATLKRSVSYMAIERYGQRETCMVDKKNLELSNGRAIIQSSSLVLMQTDASKKGWGAVCQGIKTGGLWSKKEQEYHISLSNF